MEKINVKKKTFKVLLNLNISAFEDDTSPFFGQRNKDGIDLKGVRATVVNYLFAKNNFDNIYNFSVTEKAKVAEISFLIFEISKERLDKKLNRLIFGLKKTSFDSQATGEVVDATSSLLEISQKLPKVKDAPEICKDVINAGKQLRALKHHYNDCSVILVPFRKEDNLVVFAEFTLLFSKNKIKKFIYGCIPFPLDTSTFEPQIYGLNSDPSDKTYQVTTDKQVSGSVGGGAIGPVPSASAKGTVSYGTHKTKVLPELQVKRVPLDITGSKKISFVKFKISDDRDEIVVLYHIFWFKVKDNVVLPDLRLDSYFIIPHQRDIKNLFIPSVVRSTISFGLRIDVDSKVNAIIGSVVVEPRSGKTSFINAIYKLQGNIKNYPETPYLQRHLFYNVPIGDSAKSFTFLDPRGFFFDVQNQTDMNILEKFLNGLPESTPFSRKFNYDNLNDTNNRPTHILLVFNAQSISSPIYSWWDLMFGSKSPGKLDAHLQKVLDLYNKVISYLQKRDNIDEYVASEKVCVLATHLDMIDPTQEKQIKDSITHFFREQAKTTLLFFGKKKCKWKPEQIEQIEEKRKRILLNLQPSEDFVPSKEYYIAPELCTQDGCNHEFTDETETTFKTILKYFTQESK